MEVLFVIVLYCTRWCNSIVCLIPTHNNGGIMHSGTSMVDEYHITVEIVFQALVIH